jgi:hypothetical protein
MKHLRSKILPFLLAIPLLLVQQGCDSGDGVGATLQAATLPDAVARESSTADLAPQRIKWYGKDLVPFLSYVSKLGADNVNVVLDIETSLLWVYSDGEGEMLGGGMSFNFAHTCPPRPPEECQS